MPRVVAVVDRETPRATSSPPQVPVAPVPPHGGRIWTLGTSQRSLAEFLGCLASAGIRHVVDVRRYPSSERFPHFAAGSLREALAGAGLAYHGFGDRLGGFRSSGYGAFVETDAFARGIEALEAIARAAATCVLCAERLPWRCHRIEIGKRLASRGWTVLHLLEAGRVWEPGGKSGHRSEAESAAADPAKSPAIGGGIVRPLRLVPGGPAHDERSRERGE